MNKSWCKLLLLVSAAVYNTGIINAQITTVFVEYKKPGALVDSISIDFAGFHQTSPFLNGKAVFKLDTILMGRQHFELCLLEKILKKCLDDRGGIKTSFTGINTIGIDIMERDNGASSGPYLETKVNEYAQVTLRSKGGVSDFIIDDEEEGSTEDSRSLKPKTPHVIVWRKDGKNYCRFPVKDICAGCKRIYTCDITNGKVEESN